MGRSVTLFNNDDKEPLCYRSVSASGNYVESEIPPNSSHVLAIEVGGSVFFSEPVVETPAVQESLPLEAPNESAG